MYELDVQPRASVNDKNFLQVCQVVSIPPFDMFTWFNLAKHDDLKYCCKHIFGIC